VGTSLAMSSFVGSDHTVSFKFMAQYPHAYQGPMFTTSVDDSYLIGMGNFTDGDDAVRLELAVGGSSAYFSGGNVGSDVKSGKWNTLTVVKENGKYRVYLNTQLLSREDCSSSCTEFTPGSGTISGNVRFGKNTDPNTQFYGFMDDILVFDRALNGWERWILSTEERASGSENGVIRAWTFDDAMPNGEPNPPTIGSGNFVSPAYKGLVSQTRDDAFDAKMLPPPTVTVDLPFTQGVNWSVLWGFDQATASSSHHGTAAFAWDFRRNAGEAATCGSTLRAAAGGTLIEGYDWGGDLDPGDDVPNPPLDAYNDLMIELSTPGEYLRYLHVLTGSIRAAFSVSDLPPNTPSFSVSKGTKVAEAGTRGPDNCHLHFGYSNGTVTVPLGYNYELWVSTNGGYWTSIQNGMPNTGDVIRKP
jgi:hypothetical protein